MSAVVHVAGGYVAAVLIRADETTTTVAGSESGSTEATTEVAASDPSPLTVAPKELFWSLGAFLVLLALMRLVFYPKLRDGMAARERAVTDRQAAAATAKAAADAEVADYEAALAGVRAEAQGRIDAAVRTLEAERSTKLAAVNAELAAQRASAAGELDAAKAAVRNDIAAATRDVVTAAAQRVLGAAPDGGAVGSAVERALSAEVVR